MAYTGQQVGLYRIVNVVNGKFYVGSTVNSFRARWTTHRAALRCRRHGNPHLQAAWNKYGPDAFHFSVLAVLERDEVWPSETRLLAQYVGRADCYNIGRVAGSASAGRPISDAHRAALRAANIGKIVSDETREKLRQRALARTPEHNEKIRAALAGRKNGPLSPETRAKLSRVRRGRKQPLFSDARREAMSRARKGVPWSAARRAAQDMKSACPQEAC